MKRLQLGRDDGIALVTTLSIIMVLSIALVTLISYTSSGARQASYTKASQRAYAAAEAGVNNALSQLASIYGSGASSPGSDLMESQVASPVGGASYSGGTVTWSSDFTLDASGYGGTWRIESTGVLPNPTGPNASPVQREVVAYVDVYERTGVVGAPEVWKYVYSGGTGSTCDMTIDQGVTFTAPLYVEGNLCLRNSGTIEQPSSFLAVGGNVDIQGTQGTIGSSASRIQSVYVGGSCKYKNNPWYTPCQPNIDQTRVWTTTFTGGMPSPPVTAPVINWDDTYNRARPGRWDECTAASSGTPPDFDTDAVRNTSVAGVFNLTPTTSYSCVTPSGGELSWDASSSVLTVNGIIFIDGSVEVDMGNNVDARYEGSANIYVSGTVLLKNNSTLCAELNGSTCDWASWEPGVSDGMLIFIANGNGEGQVSAGRSIEVMQAAFQGGLYGTNMVQTGQSSSVQGPIVSPDEIVPGQQVMTQFPSVIKVLTGAPGDTGPPQFVFTAPRFET
jgi:hypothetical protein